MSMTRPAWIDALAGPNALTVPGFVIVSITIMFGINSSALDAGSMATQLVGLSACAILGMVWAVAYRPVMRMTPGTARAWAVLATFAVAGTARVLVQDALLIQVGVARPTTELTIPFTILATVFWSVVTALIVDAWRKSRDASAALMREQVRHAYLVEKTEDILAANSSRLMHELEATVHDELTAAAVHDDDPKATARRLRQIAASAVREASHALAERRASLEIAPTDDDAERAPTLPWKTRIDDIADNAFLPLPTVLIVGSISFLVTTEILGTWHALIVIVSGLVVLSVLSLVARASIAPRLRTAPTTSRVIAVLVLWLLIAFSDYYTRIAVADVGDFALHTTPPFLLARTVATDVLVMLAVAVAVSTVKRARERTAGLQQELATTEQAIGRLHQVAWADQRRLATFMHGEVQARLIADAMRLAVDPDADTDTVMSELAHYLSNRFVRGLDDEPWRTGLDGIITTWAELAPIEIDVAPAAAAALDADGTAAYATVEVVREIITNGIQHGDTTWFEATITHNTGNLAVRIVSDGAIDTTSVGGSIPSAMAGAENVPPDVAALVTDLDAATDPRAGLGKRILNDACQLWWLRPLDNEPHRSGRIGPSRLDIRRLEPTATGTHRGCEAGAFIPVAAVPASAVA